MEFVGGKEPFVVQTHNRLLQIWDDGQQEPERRVAVWLVEGRGADALDLGGLQTMEHRWLIARWSAKSREGRCRPIRVRRTAWVEHNQQKRRGPAGQASLPDGPQVWGGWPPVGFGYSDLQGIGTIAEDEARGTQTAGLRKGQRSLLSVRQEFQG
jgi:hypothetical protein